MATKAKRPANAAAPTHGHTLGERFADPDLVDRLFDYVVDLLPELRERQLEIKQAVRAEFAGDRGYVRAFSIEQTRTPVAIEVLRLFNGRNATEVARQLRISRATVYRVLKQPGGNR